MSDFWHISLVFCVLIAVNFSLANPVPEKGDEKPEEPSDSVEEESSDKGTVSPEEIEKLKEEIIKVQEEDAEKFDLPLTSKPEDIETFLKAEENEYGEEMPDKVEQELAESDDELVNFVHFIRLFDQIEDEAEGKEEEEVKKTPEEMKEMKEETFKLLCEFNKKLELPEPTQEDFNKVWNRNKKRYGKRFAGKVVKLIAILKKSLAEMEATTPEETTEVSEAAFVTSTQSTDNMKEEPPAGAFALRNAKGKICILAKFHSAITITYPGKSTEQKVEVTIPHSGHAKGKCRGPYGSALLQIAWGKFVFSLHFNKTGEDTWGATSVELAYDTSEPLFDGAAEHEKVTAKSKKVNLWETPYGKSYFCPAQEVILLYHDEEQHVATVRLKEIHVQPYDVEDGKFSSIHRCNQVVIGGPDEEPFVQDETVPLAVGCTLALITLLILIGFSVHRAYNAAKVDYNAME